MTPETCIHDHADCCLGHAEGQRKVFLLFSLRSLAYRFYFLGCQFVAQVSSDWTRSNMTPQSAVGNQSDRRARDREVLSDVFYFFTSTSAASNLSDIAVCQFCAPAIFAARNALGMLLGSAAFTRSVATFALAIGHVLLMRAKEQVRRITAQWSIATVADAQAVCDWSNCLLIRDAVGLVIHDAPILLNGEFSVALGAGLAASPQPAFMRFAFVDLLPEEASMMFGQHGELYAGSV